MHEIAQNEATTHPIGASTVINDFYVDDMMAGANTEVEAIRLRDQTIEVLRKGGFQLRKWASNHTKLLEDISYTNAIEPVHFINKSEDIHTLGMH